MDDDRENIALNERSPFEARTQRGHTGLADPHAAVYAMPQYNTAHARIARAPPHTVDGQRRRKRRWRRRRYSREATTANER